jgi:hypothetical protein
MGETSAQVPCLKTQKTDTNCIRAPCTATGTSHLNVWEKSAGYVHPQSRHRKANGIYTVVDISVTSVVHVV